MRISQPVAYGIKKVERVASFRMVKSGRNSRSQKAIRINRCSAIVRKQG